MVKSTQNPSTRPAWALQHSERPKGNYYQAVHGTGKDRVTVTLGYLTKAEVQLAEENARTFSSVLLREDDRGRLFSNEQIRTFLLAEPGEHVDDVVAGIERENRTREARSKLARGDYASMTLQEFVDVVWTPIREPEVSEATRRSEKEAWNVILPVLGPLPLRKLDTARWTLFLSTRTSWSPRTKVLYQNAYRQALKYAVEVGAIKDVHTFRAVKGASKRTLDEHVPFTPAEVAALVEQAPTPAHAAMWRVAFGTGLRPTELVRMEWQDVRWSDGELFVRGTKTDLAAAEIPVTSEAMSALREEHLRQGRPKEGVIWTWRGKPIRTFRSAMETAARKAGIDDRRITPYMFRHSFATACAFAGIPKVAVKKMMRHSERSEMLDRVYEHARKEAVKEAITAFPKVVAAPKEEPKGKVVKLDGAKAKTRKAS